MTANQKLCNPILDKSGAVDFLSGFSIGAFVMGVFLLLHTSTILVFSGSRRQFYNNNDIISPADEIHDKVRVLCWVMTSPMTSRKRARHVKQTWGKHCNTLLFFSSAPDTDLPAIPLQIEDGRKHLMAKIVGSFQHVFQHNFQDADWFLKADDDAFVIVENLRYFLQHQNTNDPVYFGHLLMHKVNQGFNSGGAGYVLSKEALKRFGERENGTCLENGAKDDVKFGACMELLGVSPGRTLDKLGRTRFHCLTPEVTVNGDFPKWLHQFSQYSFQKYVGAENISQYAVSFHQVTPPLMYEMDYFLYHFKRHGVRTQYS